MNPIKIRSLALGLALAVHSACSAASSDNLVNTGRAALAAHNLAQANLCFSNAVARDPNNANANALYAVTRLLVLPDNSSPVGAFLTRLGVDQNGRDPYDWTARPATNADGSLAVPKGVNASEGSAVLRTNVLAEIAGAEANLARITDTNFLLQLTRSDTSIEGATLDYGDVLLLRAALRASLYAGYTVGCWNADVPLSALDALMKTGQKEVYSTNADDGTVTTNLVETPAPGVQAILAQYPQLLTFSNTNDLSTARLAFSSAVDLYVYASDFIRHRPANVTRLFNYSADMAANELKFRETILDLKSSLTNLTVLEAATNYSVHFAQQFDGAHAPRQFLPVFTNNWVFPGTIPDPTFGGTIFGVKSYQEDQWLAGCGLEPTPDALGWVVAKGRVFNQTNSTGLALTDPGYEVYAKVQPKDWDSINYISLELPNGDLDDLGWNEQVIWSTGEDEIVCAYDMEYSDAASLDQNYPDGAYGLKFWMAYDDNRLVSLNLTNNTNITPMRLSNFDAAQLIDPSRDFTLTWDPIPGATTNDLIQVIVASPNGDILTQSPELWSLAALDGTTTAMTIPANTLLSEDPYDSFDAFTVRLVFLKVAARDTTTFLGARGLSGSYVETDVTIQPNDVSSYGIKKLVQMEQDSTNALAAMNIEFDAWFNGSYGRVSNLSLTLPNSNIVFASTVGDDNSLSISDPFDDQGEMDAQYPDGKYVFTFDSGRGHQTLTLYLTNAPAVPMLNNFDAAQNIDANRDFSLSWNAQAGTAATDSLGVYVEDYFGYYHRWPIIGGGVDQPLVLSASASSVAIPAAALSVGDYYPGYLDFTRTTTVDATSYPGVIGTASYEMRTDFAIGAATNAQALLTTAASPLRGATTTVLTVPITWTVSNHGVGPAHNGWYVDSWLSTNGSLDDNAVEVGRSDWYDTLAAGGSQTGVLAANLPYDLAPGNYTLLVGAIWQSDTGDSLTNNLVTIPITLKPLRVADKNLAAAIRVALGRDAGDTNELTLDDMANLSDLDISSNGVTSLEGLEAAVNLGTLIANHNAITNLAPLAQLAEQDNNLYYLDLSDNPLGDCSDLAGLTRLETLLLSDVGLSDLGFLSGFENLSTLDLSTNQLTDVQALSQLESDYFMLQSVNLDGNLLNLAANADASQAIGALQNAYVAVEYELQAGNPTLYKTLPPDDNLILTNASVNLGGFVSDNLAITNVEWQVSNAWTTNAWVAATGTTNWTALATNLAYGTNTISLRARDAGGFTSPVVSLTVDLLVPFTLSINDPTLGSLSPDLCGSCFEELGTVHTLVAAANPCAAFKGWTGGITNGSKSLTFALTNALNLVANFAPVPFSASGGYLKGNYNGLFLDYATLAQQTLGSITLSATAKGSFSGTLQNGPDKYSIHGAFTNGYWSNKVTHGKSSVLVSLQLDTTDMDKLNGTVCAATAGTNGPAWTATLAADRAVTTNLPAAEAYTMVIPGCSGAANQPGGDSWGTVTVSKTRSIRFAGSLANNTKVTQSTWLSKERDWPLYVSLNSGQGVLMDWMHLDATNGVQGTNLLWLKPTVKTKYYGPQFDVQTNVLGSAYTAPARGHRLMNLTNAVVVVSGGGLAQSLTNQFTVSSNNVAKTVSTDRYKPTLSFNLSQGSFSGKVYSGKTAVSFTGVVLTNGSAGWGYFLGTNQSGQVYLSAPGL